MANKPYFLWGGDTHATSIAVSDSGVGIFKSSAPETAPALAAATAASSDTALISPELGAVAAAVARPRLRRDSSRSEKKKLKQQQQQAGGGGVGAAANKKPPQRGLGVAELERLRCGGDPLLELSAVVRDAAAAGVQGHHHPLLELSAVVGNAAPAAGAQGHPLLHYHHHSRHLPQMSVPASAFEAAGGARFCSQLLAPAALPQGPACGVQHPPPAAAAGFQFQRAAPPVVAPEQQYFRDRWSRMGGFSTACGGAAEHQSLLMPATMAPPEHPSSQSTIWRPVVSSSSSCLHTGHRCDVCSRSRRMRGLAENGGGALAPTPPDYSIYDLAAAMASARQGDAFLAKERKQGASEAEAPWKKEVREIEFFPAAASAHHTFGGGGRFSVPDESELAAPFSTSPYGAGAGGHTAPQLDLSLRL